MTIEIIVKANDGRGRGHLGRATTFINYAMFRDTLKLIGNQAYASMIPARVSNALVKDMLWRVNLDYGTGFGVYQKVGNSNHSDEEVKITDPVRTAIMDYYFSLLDNCSRETKLLYVDDQNAPETLFPDRIAKFIGIQSPGSVRSNAPNAKIAFEIETQIWDRVGDYSMGETRRDCANLADYLHLSTDLDFFRSVIGDYTFGPGLDEKIIPWGFPIGTETTRLYRSLQEKEEKTKAKENLLDMMGISGADRKKKICYVSFGAGSGAEQVYGSILEAAGRLDDYIFVISNAGVDRLLDEQGYSVSSTKRNNVKFVEAANGTKVYLTSQEQIDHMKTVALADIMIQGNGSATTYESIAAQTPMVCIPLNRPGYEQLIKGVGVELSGSGKVLFLDEVQDQLKSFRDLTHQDGNLPAKKYTTDSLVDAIGAVQKDYGNYKDALCGMQTYFADPYVTAQVLKDMSLGHEVQRIIRNNGLKSFR